jgi:hypothetical protein
MRRIERVGPHSNWPLQKNTMKSRNCYWNVVLYPARLYAHILVTHMSNFCNTLSRLLDVKKRKWDLFTDLPTNKQVKVN